MKVDAGWPISKQIEDCKWYEKIGNGLTKSKLVGGMRASRSPRKMDVGLWKAERARRGPVLIANGLTMSEIAGKICRRKVMVGGDGQRMAYLSL